MRSRASDSRLWIGRRRRGETSRRQFESARGYPSYAATIDNASGRIATRQGWGPTKIHVHDLIQGVGPADRDDRAISAAVVVSISLMGADQVFVRADLEVHPLRVPAQDLSHPFRHHR